ncbi:MAG TPA: hypothetical protein VJN92_14835 [Candidatus Acidoferrum sp.]|nr:hypothetical protein [Candidatus Acidoferrum sp.]
MRMLTAILVTALCSAGTDIGTEKKTTPSYRAESSASVVEGKDGWTYVTENRSFRFAEVLGDKGNYEALLLLEETYHNERTDFKEGMRGTATIKAWTVKPGRRREPRWTVQEAGNEGEIQDRFFRVTAWGCCDIPTVYSYYNLLTGKKVYVSNSDLLEVRGDDYPQGMRLVAFGYANMSELQQPPRLQYGTDKKVSQRFSVISSREYYDAPKVFVSKDGNLERSLDLRVSELTFIIVLRYADGTELRIPVEADVVRPEKAVLPQGYSLRGEN